MKSPQEPEPKARFVKAPNSTCLYRYSTNGVYYAFLKKGGKTHRVSLDTTTLQLAKEKLKKEQEKLNGLDPTKRGLSLEALADRFLAMQKGAAETVDQKTRIVNRLLDTFQLGKLCKVSDIKESDLKIWMTQFKFGYSSNNRYRYTLIKLFDLAISDGVITKNPATSLDWVKPKVKAKLTPSFEEFQSIVASARAEKYNAEAESSADYLEFMGLLGLGQAEVSNIRRQDINLAAGKLTITRKKTQQPFDVPIFPQAKKLVKKLHKQTKAPTDLLFPPYMDKSKNGKGSCIRNGQKALATACRKLKLPQYTQRSLRRMFITRAILKGISIPIVAGWQGHTDGGKVLLKEYNQVKAEHVDAAAKLL